MAKMDRYSRWIAVLRVVLPLAALALLSTLFLLSRGIDPETALPFADSELADRIRDQQITGPRYSGTTPRGDKVIVTATKAVPGVAGAPASALDLTGEIRLVSGGYITMQADSGNVNVPDDKAEFMGQVVIVTESGYRLTTEHLLATLTTTHATAPGPVQGTGPPGSIESGAMVLRTDDADGSAHLVFTDGVKLIYHPQTPER